MKTEIKKNESEATMVVTAEFLAPKAWVWEGWSKAGLLDRWWGPKPYDAITQSLDFVPGGKWRYYMQGPEGDKHFGMTEYQELTEGESIIAHDVFCDENGTVIESIPGTDWNIRFTEENGVTTMVHTTTFESPEAMTQYLAMGAEEGFVTCLKQLDVMLAKKPSPSLKQLRFEIEIAAPVEQVWQTMLEKETYEQWTAAFTEGSTYEGSWEEGGEIKFLDPNGEGMIGRIAVNRPNEFLSIAHFGLVTGGETKDETAAWGGIAHENYSFESVAGATKLIIDTDMQEEYVAMFQEMWPRALEKLKAVCEA